MYVGEWELRWEAGTGGWLLNSMYIGLRRYTFWKLLALLESSYRWWSLGCILRGRGPVCPTSASSTRTWPLTTPRRPSPASCYRPRSLAGLASLSRWRLMTSPSTTTVSGTRPCPSRESRRSWCSTRRPPSTSAKPDPSSRARST